MKILKQNGTLGGLSILTKNDINVDVKKEVCSFFLNYHFVTM
jgi:hypothetical protein